jgi:hypothetical protein
MIKPAMPNLKHLPYGGAGAVDDPKLHHMIRQFTQEAVDCLGDESVHEKFVDQYRQWILGTKENKIQGLHAFPTAAYSNGTTEAFDKFYLKHHGRRFRCFRGEYMYHAGSWKNYHDWAYMDQAPLTDSDALVLSMPFSDTGDIHPDTQATLDLCHSLGVPVLIDCAFFGLCAGIEFNFDHPAVTDLTFSLSKTLPVANLRIGMRLTRHDDDDSLLIYNKTRYVNRMGAGVGLKILDFMDADANYQCWNQAQSRICDQLGVSPSKTVIFGLSHGERFQEYNRGGGTHRLSFHKILYE